MFRPNRLGRFGLMPWHGRPNYIITGAYSGCWTYLRDTLLAFFLSMRTGMLCQHAARCWLLFHDPTWLWHRIFWQRLGLLLKFFDVLFFRAFIQAEYLPFTFLAWWLAQSLTSMHWSTPAASSIWWELCCNALLCRCRHVTHVNRILVLLSNASVAWTS